MKPLLSKTTKPFLFFVLAVLVISIPVYYFVVDSIWSHELDEHNRIVADKTAHQLNQLNFSPEKMQESIALWNSIQPGTNIQKVADTGKATDSIYTIEKRKTYSPETNFDRFRCLSAIITIKGEPYRLTVETNIEETRETVGAIAIITIFFFIIIVIGLLILNKKLSATIWQPFRNTLEKLKNFNLNNQSKIDFDKTDTIEFEELNQSLGKLIEHNVSVYKTQKEFTENASHELQTPLAVLKNKLDILLQSDDLTERQYHIAEEMNKAVLRSSRINKNLLLLAKIENSQFSQPEIIHFDGLLRQSIETLREHFDQKNISLSVNTAPDITVKGNGSLTEILINNLLLNAIRHTPQQGQISISLTPAILEVSNSGEKALNSEILFKRFSRQASDNSGSGLGLAIIKEICKVQNWAIDYRFENGLHIFKINM